MDAIDKIYKPPGGCRTAIVWEVCGLKDVYCRECLEAIDDEKRQLANIYEVVKLAMKETVKEKEP